MSERLDHVLKQALTPDNKPDLRLNQKILNQVKETEEMKKKNRKWVPGIVFSLVLAMAAGSGAVYAAYRMLTPKQVAEENGDKKLARAFEQEGAVDISETQHFSEYDVTLLGIASGKDIAEYVAQKNGEILDDRTYIVTAVNKTDGTEMPENLSDDAYDTMRFFVSPLIEGCDPNRVNVITMDGIYTEFVQDGVLYRLTECENIEKFADRTIYLCVSDGYFYNAKAYVFDEETGRISKSEDYKGVNALFELPLDPTLADPEAAEEYLSQFEADSDETEYTDEIRETDEFIEKVTPDTIDQYAVRLEDSVKVFGADEDGVIYSYTAKDGQKVSRYIERQREFPDGKAGMSERIGYYDLEDSIESMKITAVTLNADGTVTAATYVPK